MAPSPGSTRRHTARAVLALVLVLAARQAPAARQDAPALCADDLARQLRAWQVTGPARPQPALLPGTWLRHWPTTTLGVWVVEDASPRHAAATRVGAGRLEQVTWSADCVPHRTGRPRASAPGPSFSDGDLRTRLAIGGRGALYVWSPHMPLSVDGYRQLEPAARSRQVAVDVLLDPAANRDFARAALAAGLPASALRVVDAVELEFREATVHAPSLLVYRDGRVVEAILRGYRTTAEYEQFLDRELPPRPY
jgi:hypothetical protein